KLFGQTVMDFQNTKFTLAECATDTLAAKTFIDYCIAEHDKGNLTNEQASAAKYWASDVQNSMLDRCLQLWGGYGFMMEYPIARGFYGDHPVHPLPRRNEGPSRRRRRISPLPSPAGQPYTTRAPRRWPPPSDRVSDNASSRERSDLTAQAVR